jgi:hypothetical protein
MTIIAAATGWYIVSLELNDKIIQQPIVAWNVALCDTGDGLHYEVVPITLNSDWNWVHVNEWNGAIKSPDGKYITEEGHIISEEEIIETLRRLNEQRDRLEDEELKRKQKGERP